MEIKEPSSLNSVLIQTRQKSRGSRFLPWFRLDFIERQAIVKDHFIWHSTMQRHLRREREELKIHLYVYLVTCVEHQLSARNYFRDEDTALNKTGKTSIFRGLSSSERREIINKQNCKDTKCQLYKPCDFLGRSSKKRREKVQRS